MYSNDQVKSLCKELMLEMEGYINIMESEMNEKEPSLPKISGALGKLSKIYCVIGNLVGLWSGVDYREGGYKDSSKFMPTEHDEELDE